MNDLVLVMNWHFSRSFHFYFITLTLIIFQVSYLIKQPQSFKPFRLLTLFTDSQDKHCIEAVYVAKGQAKTTMDDPFQDKTKQQALWMIWGCTPGQDERTNYPLEDRRFRTISHQGRD
jgi:hypothetical protein